MISNKEIIKNKTNIIILFVYTILTIIFTYPVAFSWDKIPGGGDAFQFLWFLWWFKMALMSLVNPYYTTYIFYPTGVDMALSAITPFNSLLSIPLQLLFGLTGTYNILWLISFIISGYGTFLFVKYLTGDSKAAFISGLIFMFSPYHFAHALGHLNLTTIQWIPFYTLYLFKTIKENRKKYAVFAGFFLFLIAISDFYYLLFISFFTVLYFIYNIWADKDNILNKNTLKRLSIMVIIFGVLSSPFIYPVLKEIIYSNSDYMYPGGFITFSADLLGFFLPAEFHPLFKNIVSPIYKNFTGNMAEYTVFMGYTVLLLSILAIFKVKTKEIIFWLFSAILYFYLSLGPILHINGESKILGDISIYLPYSFLTEIPIFSIARVPSRWDVLLMFSLSILAGYGLNYIFNRFNLLSFYGIPYKHILSGIFSCLILFEFLAIPYPMSSTNVPDFYYQLAKDSDDYSIFEIPDINGHATYPEFMYYQTVHGKKLINGYVSRTPDYAAKFTENTPFINKLYATYLSPEIRSSLTNDIININITRAGPHILNYFNIKYIIIHKNYLYQEQLEYINNILKNTLNEEPEIYDKDNLIVYKIKKEMFGSFITLGNNWQSLNQLDNIPIRWMDKNASIIVYSGENINSNLSFNIVSFYDPRQLQVYLNNELIKNQMISTDFEQVIIPVKIEIGENVIRFDTSDECKRPIDIIQINVKNSRCLSMAFQNISLNSIS